MNNCSYLRFHQIPQMLGIPSFGFRIPSFGFWNPTVALDSKFQERNFFRILDSLFSTLVHHTHIRTAISTSWLCSSSASTVIYCTKSFKVTVKEQQDWKIPPCISNWKNAKVLIILHIVMCMHVPIGGTVKY